MVRCIVNCLRAFSVVLLLIVGSITGFAADVPALRLATTTSTDNSGLLGVLLPEFKKSHGYDVHVIAVGTGKALKLGENGDVDIVLVHAPPAEEKFIDDGYGVDHRSVMYNDFIIVGPSSDSALIKGGGSVKTAMTNIANKQALFLSRGDDSGTHKKELALWRLSGLEPAGDWYREIGQGMGKLLQIASELQAYSITDRGTWIAYRDQLDLELMIEGDPPLHNPYSIMAVNPARHPHVNYDGARALIDWMTSAQGQKLIEQFNVDGEILFKPLAS